MVASIGLGGGSLVTWQQDQKQQQEACRVGPVSVGSALTSSSLVCEGSSLTASDVAVLLHDRLPGLVRRADVPAAASEALDTQRLQQAWQVGRGEGTRRENW